MPDAYEQRRPFQEDGHLAVPDCTCPLKWPPEHLPECPSSGAPQEPRTGGVLVRWDGGYGMFVPNSYGTQTHRVFPLADAEALLAVVEKARQSLLRRDAISHAAMPEMAESLIDPNDPAVRDLVVMAVKPYAHDECANIADAVLAALRGAK